MELYAVITLIAVAFLVLGLVVRRWWLVPILSLPSVVLLVGNLSTWGEDVGDGMTGATWFLFGFIFVGAPLIAPAALGVLLGRLLFGRPEQAAPRGRPAGGPPRGAL